MSTTYRVSTTSSVCVLFKELFIKRYRFIFKLLYIIIRTKLEEARAQLRNKDRQIEEAQEAHDEDLKAYKQKVKHLQYEHQADLTDTKSEALVALQNAQDDHTQQEREILRDKAELKRMFREHEGIHDEQIKNLKLQHSEEIHKIREEFNIKAKELENKYEKKFQELREELQIKHRMELTEIEERKNTQIENLIQHHDQAFTEMKNYYNDITLNNLALISSLKDQMELLRKQNERMTKQVSDLMAENKKMVEPLRQALADVAEYKRRLQNYEKDKIALANATAKLQTTMRDLNDLQWCNEALELRLEKVEAERDELRKKFTKAVLEVQQKTGLKNALLQKRVDVLNDAADRKDALIGQMQITRPHMRQVNQKLEEILTKKNTTIQELQYELARVCKAHDDLLATYEEKLLQYGIPKEELGFKPMRVVPEGQANVAYGPAGLVTKNR
ncbi:dynein regulatory complex subunit 4 [Agrilus planipennis]|uniref:Dynein regulatory complex subunit 4 n=1 Tax=Agrilus planipennis TaxID=224129 RepID=A0A1W4X1Q9_AGRPL|nr:dynein regulatory complex subunit 4 [Agrilus planipennis]